MKNQLTESLNTIKQLHNLYKNDEHMIDKLHNYIQKNLPKIMNNLKNANDERISRTNELTQEYKNFISNYLNSNKYFYISATERYYHYDGVNYTMTTEDSILHHILTTITKERTLLNWKYKTKVTLMKNIKDQSLFNNVPESITIQNVINSLYPTLFSSKYAAKYFLTVIGDNILKKYNSHIHFVPMYSKIFIRELNNLSQTMTGINCTNTFKMKYHEDHEYNNCRIINIHETVKYENIWKPIIENHYCNIICVALYYSTRFGNADTFLEQYTEDFDNQINFLKNNTKQDIINDFIKLYFTFDTDDQENSKRIEWKDIFYLWNHFLNKQKLPSIMYQSEFLEVFKTSLTEYFIEKDNNFTGLFSKFLPSAQQFIDFWKDTMTEDPNESFLEIDEIRKIFHMWNSDNKKTQSTLNNQQIIDILCYFFNDICVEDDKFIHEYKCSLWDKPNQLTTFLTNYKEYYLTNNLEDDPSIDDLYLFYCNLMNNEKISNLYSGLIVDKAYFKRFIRNYMSPYVENDIISSIWFNE